MISKRRDDRHGCWNFCGAQDLRVPCPWAVQEQKGAFSESETNTEESVSRWMDEVLPDPVEHGWDSNRLIWFNPLKGWKWVNPCHCKHMWVVQYENHWFKFPSWSLNLDSNSWSGKNYWQTFMSINPSWTLFEWHSKLVAPCISVYAGQAGPDHPIGTVPNRHSRHCA